jgi:hypothetical protein
MRPTVKYKPVRTPRYPSVEVAPDTLRGLADAARVRGMTTEALASTLLETIAKESLASAVLDDGK